MAVEKGLLANEDINFGIGTFTRKGRTGFPITVNQVSDLIAPTGGPLVDSRRFASFNLALAAAVGKTLLLAGSSTMTANATVSAGTSILPLITGVIVSGGFTLTINGPVVGNPMHQWLSGFAAADISGLSVILPEWVGALADGTTDDSTALQLALDYWLRGSNRHLTMRGAYRCDSTITITSPKAISAHNCTLDAYGAIIQSYVTGKAVCVNPDGDENGTTGNSTGRFERNILNGLTIQAMNANVNTLLKLGGWEAYASLFNDIRLIGYNDGGETPVLTTQGLLFYGADCYYNMFTNLTVWDCERLVSVNRDHVAATNLTISERSNANKIVTASLYGMGTTGVFITHSTGNSFLNLDFTNSYTANEDVYLDTNATDNLVTGRHESGATYTHSINDGADGNTIETNKNLSINGSALAQRQNTIIKLSSTNSKIDINALRSRYLYNHAGQPISIRHNVYNSGNDAAYVDNNGLVLHAPRIISEVVGLADEVRMTATAEAAGGGATTLPTADATHGPSDVTGDGWLKIYIGTQAAWIPYWHD